MSDPDSDARRRKERAAEIRKSIEGAKTGKAERPLSPREAAEDAARKLREKDREAK